MPIDHLPKSLRDQDCVRRDQEIERRKRLFRQAKAASAAVRSITERQPAGGLSRAEGAVLAHMIRQNLRSCVRGERFYRPTRKGIARETGYTERTVSAALSKLKSVGIIVAARYAKGGRLGDKGKGISTEYRTGCLQFLTGQLKVLGYRLPKSLAADLSDLGTWAAWQMGEATETKLDTPPKPTGKKLPGIVMPTERAAPEIDSAARVAAEEAPFARLNAPPGHVPRFDTSGICRETQCGLSAVAHPRPALGRLARSALPFSAYRNENHPRYRWFGAVAGQLSAGTPHEH